MRFLLLLLSLPWWVSLPVAGGALYLGHVAYLGVIETKTVQEEALRAGPPAPVDLSNFDRAADVGPAQEVNVIGWIDSAHNHRLVERVNGAITSEKYLYMLFGKGDGTASGEVRAAVVLSKAEKDYFISHLDDFVIGRHGDNFLFNFNGAVGAPDGMSSLVNNVIAGQGLTMAGDFFYLDPFLTGREVAFASAEQPLQPGGEVWLGAIALLLIFAANRVLGRSAKSKAVAWPTAMKGAQAGKPANANAVAAQNSEATLSCNIAPDSPLGRIALKCADPACRERARKRRVVARRVVSKAKHKSSRWIFAGATGCALPLVIVFGGRAANLPVDPTAGLVAVPPQVSLYLMPFVLSLVMGVTVALLAKGKGRKRRKVKTSSTGTLSVTAKGITIDPRTKMRCDPFKKLSHEVRKLI